jgi:murein DD-endopeptidase MepM/ murein hydrolase activator NlpD
VGTAEVAPPITKTVNARLCSSSDQGPRQAKIPEIIMLLPRSRRNCAATGTKPLIFRLPARYLIGAVAVAIAILSAGCTGFGERGPGVIHHVEAGENIYRISLRYRVDPKQVARVNGIRDVTKLKVGQRLFIPGVRRSMKVQESARLQARSDAALSEVRKRARAAARSQTKLRFAWPARGRLSSRFGMRKGRPHEGIDLAASRGTPIYAAESGRVIHSGRLSGYGKVVIVKHAGAFRTVYAHASKLLVKKGAFVERREKIALVGSTGRSTGPHVHFEIRRSEKPLNPLAFLPRKR